MSWGEERYFRGVDTPSNSDSTTSLQSHPDCVSCSISPYCGEEGWGVRVACLTNLISFYDMRSPREFRCTQRRQSASNWTSSKCSAA